MEKEIKELPLNPEKKFAEMVETGRKSAESLFPGEEAVFAGWQLHYVVGGVLSSIGGYSIGFNLDDYEGQ